jgi:hypothetical protein
MTSLRGGRSDPNDHSNYSDDEIAKMNPSNQTDVVSEANSEVQSTIGSVALLEQITEPIQSIVSETHLEDMKRWKQEYEDKRQVVYNHPIPPFEFKEETVTTQELEVLPLWVMNLNIRRDNIRLNIEHETFHDFEGFMVEDMKAIMEPYL